MTDIVEVARACIGTKFVHQGRQPGVGLDCGGLVAIALRGAGFDVQDYHGYGRIPDQDKLLRVVDSQPCLTRIDQKDADAGDVVVIRFGAHPSHVGILTAKDYIIHAFEPIGRVVEHRIDKSFQAQIVAAYRVKE